MLASNFERLVARKRRLPDTTKQFAYDPQDASAYVLRAVAYTRLGNDQEAQQDIDRAVELGFDRGGLESEIEDLKNKR